jgi:hypothetical protein
MSSTSRKNSLSLHPITNSFDRKPTLGPSPKAWTNQLENSVKHIGDKATGYKIMHVKAARGSKCIYNFLMYLGILCGPVAGFLSGVTAIFYPTPGFVLQILSTFIAMLSGILVAIVKFGNFEESTSSHKLAAARYTSLESNVRRQLLFCKRERLPAGQYMDYIGSSYDELFMSSPFIPAKIYKHYARIAKAQGLVVPDEYGLTVKINMEYEEKTIKEVTRKTAVEINKDDVTTPEPQQRTLLQKTKDIKRSTSGVPMADLSKYSDGQMNYEIKRMMGFR